MTVKSDLLQDSEESADRSCFRTLRWFALLHMFVF